MAVNGEDGKVETTASCERIDSVPTVPLPTTINPTSTPPIREEMIPQISETGPYAIKHVGQQVTLNPSWSPEQVELMTQVNISTIKLTCSPFLSTAYAGWLAWLRERTFTTSRQTNRDASGIIGTGLGVLNSIKAESTCKRTQRNRK